MYRAWRIYRLPALLILVFWATLLPYSKCLGFKPAKAIYCLTVKSLRMVNSSPSNWIGDASAIPFTLAIRVSSESQQPLWLELWLFLVYDKRGERMWPMWRRGWNLFMSPLLPVFLQDTRWLTIKSFIAWIWYWMYWARYYGFKMKPCDWFITAIEKKLIA